MNNNFGQIISSRRKGLKLTQEKLADMIERSPGLIGQIERGESMPSVETLALIMYELNIDPRLIFIDGDIGSSSEYDELYLLLRRMSVSQRKLVLDFAKMIRSYKII